MTQEVLEADLDIFMYAGRWYEIAKLPNPWETRCFRSTADYYVDDSPLRRGQPAELDIVNTCYNKQGEIIDQGEARGWIPDPNKPAALVVEFEDNPVKGWYLVHRTDYVNFSIVGSPDRQFLWILSRNPEMCENVYKQLLYFIEKIGYDRNRIEKSEGAVIKCPYGPGYSTDIPR